MRAYLCVTIDCECDKGPGWRTQKPLAFRGVADGIGQRLQPLFARHRAKPTYLLSPEVMRDEASVALLRGLDADLGAHLHGELAEPGAFVPDVTVAMQRDYPRDVEAAKLASLTELFRAAFGRAPACFRAGRFGLGESSLELLASLGYRVDSSVTPFMDWSDKAPGLSYVGAPTQPYHPDPRAPAKRGASPLLEVPVTIRPGLANRVPIVGKRIDPRWLRPTRGTARALVDLAKDEIAASAGERTVILNCMFHNVEVVPGLSPYADDERDARAILDRLDALLAFANREGVAVIGLSDVPAVL